MRPLAACSLEVARVRSGSEVNRRQVSTGSTSLPPRSARFAGNGKVTVVQPNLLKKTIDADRVYRLSSPSPMLIHTEWESGSELGRPSRFLLYNTLLWDQTKLPVKTVVVLLRKEANSTDLTGVLTRTLPDEQEYLVWRYSVIRLWELPPDLFLASPGLTPLAPLGAVSEEDLPSLARQMQQIWSSLPESQIKELKSAAEVLMGLRFEDELLERLFDEVATMEESVIYQKILHKGEAKARSEALEIARETLVDIGTKQLGAPTENQRKIVERCGSLRRLRRMTVAAVDAPDWAAVLATK